MEYQEALSWVHSLPRLANTAGVDNTRRLLAVLGNPQQALRIVHIAGTNGKGSATVMLSSVLQKAGYRVGTTVSPYVLDFRERFMCDGQMISCDALAEILTRVRAAVDELRRQDWQNVVEFDVVTAAALLWFAEEKCDVVCLETGLGGRLDSTNAVETTILACIMHISKDHTELLGDDYASIAAEKCGILKNRCPVVCYPVQPQAAMDEIVLRAQKAGCRLIVPDAEDLQMFRGRPFENHIDYGGYEMRVPFAGAHQALNAAVVVHAALELCQLGFTVDDDAIMQGIEQAKFPARIEVLSTSPLIIVDGAHNPDGAAALAATLRTAKVRNLTAVIGMLQGKNEEQCLAALAPFVSSAYTVTPASPRALTAQQLAQAARRHFAQVQPCEDVAQALQAAQSNMDGGLLVCGSLYLAAEARKILMRD